MRLAPALVALSTISWPGIAPAGAVEPPRRYGDPVAAPARSELAARVEGLCRRLAAAAGQAGPDALEVDRRLEAVMDLLVPLFPASGPPPVELTARALWLAGIVEPPPYMLAMTVPDGADEDVLRQTERLVPDVLARARYRRLAVSTAPLRPGVRRLVLALQESGVALAPIPRALPAGGRATVEGRVAASYHAAAVFVTEPGGEVTRLPVQAGEGGAFRAELRCTAKPGPHQVEVAAEDRFGEAVLANFPVHCGAPAPSRLEAPPPAAAPARPATGDPVPDAGALPALAKRDPIAARAAAEARVLELLNADRAQAGLPPLAPDAQLAKIARGHSEDMRDHRFFGHLSPSTGSAMDRVQRAAIPVLRVRENLGRAWSPEELERGLMNSPAHRANILASDVAQVGIGVAIDIGAAGALDLYLTQLFAQPPAPFDPLHAPSAMRARLDEIRREAKLAIFGADGRLDELAQQVARAMADERGAGKGDPVDRALPALAERYRWVRKVSARLLDVTQLTTSPALVDREATHAGVAAVRVARAGKAGEAAGGDVLVVVLLAARR